MRLCPAIPALLILLLATPLAAQAPKVENITVTGARTRKAIEGFVQSLATPTRAIEKIARWQKDICPIALGLKPEFLAFITKRLKEVAAQVGAPVDNSPSCQKNAAIIFTTAPQALIDNVRKKTPGLLGYYDNQDQLDAMAKVTRPIQAWYTTATEDVAGQITVDTGRTAGMGLMLSVPCNLLYPGFASGGICYFQPSGAHGAAVSSTRLGDGLKSGLYNVIIVADPSKLADDEIGALADTIAMLALAQVKTQDACQPLDSILNLLATGCPRPTALTANDIGYLTALYKMSPESTIQVQRNEMAYQMQQTLGVK
jgi:hypothetical protein